jgi:Ser/Thr protein kinase RdoA (MazF antagonist)
MQLLTHTPVFDPESAALIAEELFGLRAAARALPSERDQNFLLTDAAGGKFVLKIANALESRELLEAQNAVLEHVGKQLSFCPRVIPTLHRELIGSHDNYDVRLVTYLPGVPLAELATHSPELLRDLGRKLGRLDRAMADFDHPAAHRDFHWDLANGNRLIDNYAEPHLQELVARCRFDGPTNLRRSVIHGDANDYNVLVDSDRVTGVIDFGDMVYSWTIGNLAIAIAYVVLGKEDPFAAATHVVEAYTLEFPIDQVEREVLWKLVRLRLAMSVCLAAQQLRQRPDNEYLRISQQAIAETLPRLFDER